MASPCRNRKTDPPLEAALALLADLAEDVQALEDALARVSDDSARHHASYIAARLLRKLENA